MAVVINLLKRPDRIEGFYQRVDAVDHWPFEQHPRRWAGIDGHAIPAPSWSQSRKGHLVGPGSWGCTQAYAFLFSHCLSEGIDRLLVFEDDCFFVDDFGAKARAFMAEVPDDWDWIYFGGNIREPRQFPPVYVSPRVIRPRRVTATHCFAVNARAMHAALAVLYELPIDICDATFSVVHKSGQQNVYHAYPPLAGQLAGDSDIARQGLVQDYLWPLPKTVKLRPPGSDLNERCTPEHCTHSPMVQEDVAQ